MRQLPVRPWLGAVVVLFAALSAAGQDLAEEWTARWLDSDAYLEGRVEFVPGQSGNSIELRTADLGGCSEIHQRVRQLLPQLVSVEELREALRRGSLSGRGQLALRCLGEADGTWFLVLDAQREWCGNRGCNVEHRVRPFRLLRTNGSEPLEPLAQVTVNVRADGGGWQLMLARLDGQVSGMLVVSEQWGPPTSFVRVVKFVDGERRSRPVGDRSWDPGDWARGVLQAWSGDLLGVAPVGGSSTIGYLVLGADDDPIPWYEVHDVSPDGDLEQLLTSADFGASDDPVAREPTLLQANLRLIEWSESVIGFARNRCPGADDHLRTALRNLRNRMQGQLAPYLEPCPDPVDEEFAAWWEIGVSRAASPFTCEPWTSATSNPRFSWRAAYGNGVWVAVSRSDRVYFSLDGLNWDEIGPPWPGPANDVGFGGGLFRLVGDAGRIWSSADGVNWDPEPTATSSDLFAVTWTGSQWIAVGDDGVVVSIRDGATREIDHIANGSALLDVVAHGELVVVVGQLGPRGVAVSSTCDGRWKVATLPRPLIRVHASCGEIIAIDDEFQPWTSVDGAEWRVGDTRAPLIVSELENTNGSYLLAADGRLGLLNEQTGRLWFYSTSPASRDEPRLFSETLASPVGGIAIVRGEREDWVPIFSFEHDRYHQWDHGRFQPGPRTPYEKLVQFAGGFVASSGGRGIGWSNDGRHWRWLQLSEGYRGPVELRVAGPLAFAWPRQETRLYVSADGRSWTASVIDLGRFSKIVDVTWTGDRWLLLAESEPLLESLDGISWAPSPAGPPPPRFSQAVSQLGGEPIIATYFEGAFGLARPDGSGAWCPAWTQDGRTDRGWRLASEPGGPVLVTNRGARVLATTDGASWHDLLPEIDRHRSQESCDFQQAITHPDGVDLFALSDGQLMKSECRWR